MGRRWKISKVNRITERKGRLGAVNTWCREMYDVRNVQRKGRKSMWNGGRGGTEGWLINEKLGE